MTKRLQQIVNRLARTLKAPHSLRGWGHAPSRNFVSSGSRKRYFYHFQAGLLIIWKSHIGDYFVRKKLSSITNTFHFRFRKISKSVINITGGLVPPVSCLAMPLQTCRDCLQTRLFIQTLKAALSLILIDLMTN